MGQYLLFFYGWLVNFKGASLPPHVFISGTALTQIPLYYGCFSFMKEMHWRRNIQPILVLQKTSYRAGMLPRDPLQSILFLSQVRVFIYRPFRISLQFALSLNVVLWILLVSLGSLGFYCSLGFVRIFKKCCFTNA